MRAGTTSTRSRTRCTGSRRAPITAAQRAIPTSRRRPSRAPSSGSRRGGGAAPGAPAPPEPRLVERISAWAAERFDLAAPEPVAAETCLYTTTPDQEFVLERRGRVVIGSPCSGHGFKFAPAIGARLARLATQA